MSFFRYLGFYLRFLKNITENAKLNSLFKINWDKAYATEAFIFSLGLLQKI